MRFIDKVGHHDAVITVENIINHSAIDMICMEHVHTMYDIEMILHWNKNAKPRYLVYWYLILVHDIVWFFKNVSLQKSGKQPNPIHP